MLTFMSFYKSNCVVIHIRIGNLSHQCIIFCTCDFPPCLHFTVLSNGNQQLVWSSICEILPSVFNYWFTQQTNVCKSINTIESVINTQNPLSVLLHLTIAVIVVLTINWEKGVKVCINLSNNNSKICWYSYWAEPMPYTYSAFRWPFWRLCLQPLN